VILHDWDYEEKKHNNICDIWPNRKASNKSWNTIYQYFKKMKLLKFGPQQTYIKAKWTTNQ
jgi:hypothetical protein